MDVKKSTLHYGVYGNAHAADLQKNNPAYYKELEENGTLGDYLESYQEKQKEAADRLTEKYEEELGVDEMLKHLDYAEYMIRVFKAQVLVRNALLGKKESEDTQYDPDRRTGKNHSLHKTHEKGGHVKNRG